MPVSRRAEKRPDRAALAALGFSTSATSFKRFEPYARPLHLFDASLALDDAQDFDNVLQHDFQPLPRVAGEDVQIDVDVDIVEDGVHEERMDDGNEEWAVWRFFIFVLNWIFGGVLQNIRGRQVGEEVEHEH